MEIQTNQLADLARICADITRDGHLQIQGWRNLTSFYCNDEKQILKTKHRFKTLFGVDGRVYTRQKIICNIDYL